MTKWIKTPCDTSACVEVGKLDHGDFAIRNSIFEANRIVVTRAEMAAFIQAVKDGVFDELVRKL